MTRWHVALIAVALAVGVVGVAEIIGRLIP